MHGRIEHAVCMASRQMQHVSSDGSITVAVHLQSTQNSGIESFLMGRRARGLPVEEASGPLGPCRLLRRT